MSTNVFSKTLYVVYIAPM